MLATPSRTLAKANALPRVFRRLVSSGTAVAADGSLGVASSRSSRAATLTSLPQAPAAPSAQQTSPPRVQSQRYAKRMQPVPIEQLEMADDPHESSWKLGQQSPSAMAGGHVDSTPAAFAELRVGDVLASKASTYGTQVHTVSPEESLGAALQTMSFFNVGALVVLEGGSLAGVLSTRDLLKRIDDEWRAFDPKSTKVRELMTPGDSVVYVDANTTVLRCMKMMTEGGFRHLPVLAQGRVTGVLSIGDCVRAMMTQYQDKSDYLEDLVKGKYPA